MNFGVLAALARPTLTMSAPAYTESSIRILEGLEPVKARPGMYTRTESPLHIMQEVLDNAVDEAIGGFATRIDIEMQPDGFILLRDNGRGIPVGLHPEKKIPVVEAVFTILHAGGKFDKAAGGAYSFSGGLHGVGVSVTNALSERMEVLVTRDGWQHEIVFSNGDVVVPLKRLGRAEGSGTQLRVQPNPKYFDSPEVPAAALRELVKSKAVLLPGLVATFRDARTDPAAAVETYSYNEGLVTYLGELSPSPALVPVMVGERYAGADDTGLALGEGAAWAFGFYEQSPPAASFVNLIPTPHHGTHVAGLRQALFNAVKAHIEHHSLMPKGIKLAAEDVFKNVGYVLSAKVLDPSFEGQTKDRLNSRDAVRLLERMVQPAVEAWLNLNPAHAKTVAELCLRNAAARQRQGKTVERRKTSSVVMLPGKLADCESSDASVTELFLVEGDSAGGSAKMARLKDTQAILAMRGKGLNAWEKDAQEALANAEVHDIATAIGLQPHALSDELDWGKLRYGKVCVLADADVDGFHIQVLLLTLFFRHFPQLIERGHLYIACPPLYRLDAAPHGKRPARKVYALDEAELRQAQEKLSKEGYRDLKVGRFKGLGEMDPPELWETTLNPDTRRLVQVRLPEELRSEAVEAMDNLMARNKADWRRAWLERRGHEAHEG